MDMTRLATAVLETGHSGIECPESNYLVTHKALLASLASLGKCG
jgi:hypothetical protein